MSVECDIRHAICEDHAASLPPDEATPATDLRAAARRRGREPNAFTGTPAVLAVSAAAEGALVDRAAACIADATTTPGHAPLEFVPDAEVARTSSGACIVHFHQNHRGIPVQDAVRSVVFGPDGTAGAILGDHIEIDDEVDVQPALAAADAVQAAARHLGEAGAEVSPERKPIKVSSVAPRLLGSFPLPSRPTLLAKKPFAEPVTARLVLLYCAPGDVRLGWLVSLELPNRDEEYDLIVAANGAGAGEILYCQASFDTARASVFRHSPDDPGGRVEIDLPLARDAYPPFADVGEIDPFGRGWIADRSTRGNNAVAFSGNRRRATLRGRRDRGSVVFAPRNPEGEDQCLLNAFYYCNYLHDFFALLGFGEAEGNFQRRNFTGAPGERDELEIRVFRRGVDGTARMRSRRDGRRGQLLLGPRDDTGRHSALDADIVYHEYAHGVTTRLIGGRMSVDPLRHPESRALAEGYSDYFALTIQSHQLGREKLIFGDWLADGHGGGLRRHPYDDDFPLHYGDLADPENQPAHRGGEIWCAALMRMNRRIGEILGTGRGHEIGWQLVVDSLKLLPTGPDKPGFLDARDAITYALHDFAGRLDTAEHSAVERAVLEAFARTGMGLNARGAGARFRGLAADFTLPS